MPEYRAHDPGSGAHAYGYSARCPHFHAFIHDPALVDAILDRLIYSSHKLELKGESMRKKRFFSQLRGERRTADPAELLFSRQQNGAGRGRSGLYVPAGWLEGLS